MYCTSYGLTKSRYNMFSICSQYLISMSRFCLINSYTQVLLSWSFLLSYSRRTLCFRDLSSWSYTYARRTTQKTLDRVKPTTSFRKDFHWTRWTLRLLHSKSPHNEIHAAFAHTASSQNQVRGNHPGWKCTSSQVVIQLMSDSQTFLAFHCDFFRTLRKYWNLMPHQKRLFRENTVFFFKFRSMA